MPVMMMATSVRATGFVDHNAKIYTEEKGKTDSKDRNDTMKAEYADEFSDHETGAFEQFFGELVFSVGDFFHSVLKNFGFDIDSIVLGRVNYGKQEVNLFGFELAPKNPYGVVGSIVYKTLRSIVYLLLVVQCMALLSKYAWKMSPRDYVEGKRQLTSTWMIFIALAIMPFALDIAIYVRDVILYTIRGSMGALVGNPGFDLWDSMVEGYEASDHALVPGMLCLGAAALSVSFMYAYLMIALTVMLLMICFAIICAYGPERRKKTLDEWLYTLIANLLVPIIDYILIMVIVLIPYIIGKYNMAIEIIQLVLAWLIIKARNMVFSILALRTGHDNSLMGGLMGVMAAAKLARSAMKTVGKAFGSARDGYESYQRSREEQELDDLDRDRPEYSDNEGVGNRNDLGNGNDQTTGQGEREENEGLNEANRQEFEGEPDNDNLHDGQNEYERLQNENSSLNDENDEIGEAIDGNNRQIHDNNIGISRLKEENQEKRDRLDEIGDSDPQESEKLQKEIDDNDKEIGQLKDDNRQLESHNRSLDNQRKNNLGKISNNRSRMQGMDQRTAGEDSGNKGVFNDMTNRYDPNTATPKEKKMHDIALRRANLENFDSPEFAGKLSHQEMADFYRRRAVKRVANATGQAAGGVTGAVVGAGMMSWFGPQAMMYGAGVGMDVAGSIGGQAGTVGMGAWQLAGKVQSRMGRGGGQSMEYGPVPGTYYGGGMERQSGFEPNFSDIGNVEAPRTNVTPAGEMLNPETRNEGAFMFDEQKREQMRNQNEAMKSVQYMDVADPAKQEIAINGRLSYYDMALQNGDMSKNEVIERIRRDALDGSEKLSSEEQQKAMAWADRLEQRARERFNL